MSTRLYLLRHGATAANLVQPYRLQGRRTDAPLAPEGIRQAERARDCLARHSIQHFYTSPLRRAMQTAEIIAQPHGRSVQAIAELIECDVGRWEGLSWEMIQAGDGEKYQEFLADPATHGYPDGETFADVFARVTPVFEQLLRGHEGEDLLVVGHHVVNRVYLAALLGLPPARAREIKLDNCAISIVVQEDGAPRVAVLAKPLAA